MRCCCESLNNAERGHRFKSGVKNSGLLHPGHCSGYADALEAFYGKPTKGNFHVREAVKLENQVREPEKYCCKQYRQSHYSRYESNLIKQLWSSRLFFSFRPGFVENHRGISNLPSCHKLNICQDPQDWKFHASKHLSPLWLDSQPLFCRASSSNVDVQL